jgi:N6-L-threonylcarbamoyladenine synthase
MRVLGIETTCDETAAAVVRLRPDGTGEILADEVMSQIAAHAPFGGVVPEIAARAHVEIIDSLIARALTRAKVAAKDLDGVAAAAGPGLIGGVLVGLMAGKGVALACGKPFVAVNHLEAHALTARLTASVGFPYLVLIASGGHTQILAVKGVGDYDRLGATMDDAIGEAFDKTAKLLGLPFRCRGSKPRFASLRNRLHRSARATSQTFAPHFRRPWWMWWRIASAWA